MSGLIRGKNMNTDKLRQIYIDNITMESEPFIQLPKSIELSKLSKEQAIFLNQQRRQQKKFDFFLNTFDFLNDSQIRGDYFEFGCHRARTFRMALTAAAFYKIVNINFFAFDSFEGLPPRENSLIEQWKEGALSTSEDDFKRMVGELGLYRDSITTIKGFYDESLSKITKEKLNSAKACFINIDCDYYESAVSVFSFIEPYLQHGTVIYLDDVFAGFKKEAKGGVRAAFNEFKQKSSFDFIQHLSIGWWGQSFITSERTDNIS